MVFIITSFLAGVESGHHCLLNFEVFFCFPGVTLSIRSSFLFISFWFVGWDPKSRLHAFKVFYPWTITMKILIGDVNHHQ